MEYVVTLEQRSEQPAAVVRGQMSVEGIPGFIGAAFGEVLAVIGAQHLIPAGPPFGRYRIVEGGFDVEAGFPTSGPATAAGRVEPTVLPGGAVATTLHVGSYDDVAAAYRAVTDWIEASGYVVTGDPWESYLDGPEVAEPRTTVCFPCREA
jgi:effector-binding domain-containing protein